MSRKPRLMVAIVIATVYFVVEISGACFSPYGMTASKGQNQH